MVALDLAREIRGSRTQAALAPVGDTSNPASAASKSVSRNAGVLGDDLAIQVDWGSYDGTWNTATDPPSAVRVIASANTDYAVVDGSGAVTRTAYATASSSACYRLGSFVAAVKAADSTVLGPLNDLFDVNLHLVSYQALADATVTLGELAATSAIGSPTPAADRVGDLLQPHRGPDRGAVQQAGFDELGGSQRARQHPRRRRRSWARSFSATSCTCRPTDKAALLMALNVLDIVGSAGSRTATTSVEVPNINGERAGRRFAVHRRADADLGRPARLRQAELLGERGPQRAARGHSRDRVRQPAEPQHPGFRDPPTSKGDGTLSSNIADGTGEPGRTTGGLLRQRHGERPAPLHRQRGDGAGVVLAQLPTGPSPVR